jgi:uncharacterized protein
VASGMIARLAMILVFAIAATVAQASSLGIDNGPGHTYPGKFVWFDLATENPDAVRAFYGRIFDWQFSQVENAPASYTIIEHNGQKIAGMFQHARPAGALVGSRWLAFISVADPAKAAQYAVEHGGQVLRAPETVPGRGTQAILRDPDGAAFGVFATSVGDPPDDPVIDGDVFWLDLFTPEPEKEAAFYAGLAGYSVSETLTPAGHKRWVLAAEDIARAGIVMLPPGKGGTGWLPYFLVEDVPGTLDRVRSAGGRVIVEPRPDLLDGRVAVIADPTGGVVGIVDWEIRVDPPGPAQ